jgi:Sugar (and other) transporter.
MRDCSRLWHGDGIPGSVSHRVRDNPSSSAGPLHAILEGFWPIGFITAGLLSLVILPYWGWRGVFLLQAIPALFVFVIRRYVPESPRWLAERGRSVDAEKVMGEIETKVKRRLGGAELPSPRTNPDPTSCQRCQK